MKAKALFSGVGLIVIGIMSCGPAWAIPVLSTDIMGDIQRLLSWAQRAENVAQTASNYAQNVMQTYMMVRNLKSAPLQTLSTMNGPSGQAYQAYSNLSYQAGTLASDINGQNAADMGAYNSFSLSGLSPSAFIQAEQNDAYGTNSASQTEVQSAIAATKTTDSQIQAVQNAEQAIPADSGMQKQLQLLNEQDAAQLKADQTEIALLTAKNTADGMKNHEKSIAQAQSQIDESTGAATMNAQMGAAQQMFGGSQSSAVP
ncbi:MAG: hypothetical protein ACYDEV_00155 [Acidiferrobacter sp.]